MDIILKIKSILQNSRNLTGHQASAFFKTGKGQYAEGEEFIGVPVPTLRRIAKQFKELSLEGIHCLLVSKINEERFLALIILGLQYQKGSPEEKEELYKFYLKSLPYINNWNLVDVSAYLIIGAHLWDKERSLLLDLAKSEILWERRISIVATLFFIRKNDLEWTFKIAHLLINDSHDLLHKATGWMLREAGKRDEEKLREFLKNNTFQMPRTMLRYAIEKFPEDQRKFYLKKK